MAGVDAVIHAATLHKPHVASHGRGEFVDTNITGTLNLLEEAVAAGRQPLRVHQHDEHVRPRADPGAGRAGGVDHRGGPAGAAQHLRRHQDRGRGPVRARLARPRPAVPDPAHLALLPRGRRPRRCARGVRRPQPQGQRAALPPGGHRGRGRRAPAGAGARAGRSASAATSSARPRRSRATMSPSCTATRRRGAAAVPGLRGDLRRARLDDAPGHRPRLRQRPRPRGARLVAALRLPPCAGPGRGRRGSAQPAGAHGRRQGLPRQPTGVYTTRARDSTR